MSDRQKISRYSLKMLRDEAKEFLSRMLTASSLEIGRERLFRRVTEHQYDTFRKESQLLEGRIVRVRDCTRAMRSI